MTLRAVATNEEPEEGQLAIFESKPVALFTLSVQGIKDFVPTQDGEPVALHHGDRVIVEVEAEVETIILPEPRKAVKLADGSRIRTPVGKLTRKHVAKANRAVLVSVEPAEEPDSNIYGERREG